MPRSYHVNSHSKRFKDVPAPPKDGVSLASARRAAGLPQQGTLYCSYNQFFKIDAAIARVWSRILSKDPGAALVVVKFMFWEYGACVSLHSGLGQASRRQAHTPVNTTEQPRAAAPPRPSSMCLHKRYWQLVSSSIPVM